MPLLVVSGDQMLLEGVLEVAEGREDLSAGTVVLHDALEP